MSEQFIGLQHLRTGGRRRSLEWRPRRHCHACQGGTGRNARCPDLVLLPGVGCKQSCVSPCYQEGVWTPCMWPHTGASACNDGKPGGSWLGTQALETCRTIVSTIYSWGPRVGVLICEINLTATKAPIVKGPCVSQCDPSPYLELPS